MKALKIIGWTLLGIVLAVVVAVTIACYVVFTPERLTPIARNVADKFITCEYEIGEVDLTFFSTFPRFGLRADGLLIINPKAGAQNDTVVSAPKLVATVDVMEFLNRKNLHVHELQLSDALVNFYIAPDGTTNLTDVFVTSPDTTEEDTTAFSLPFDELKVDGLKIEAKYITFADDKDTISASLGETELSAKAEKWDDMRLALDANNVCALLKGERYADSLHVQLDAPMAMDLNAMHFAFRKAELAVNEFELVLNGTADIKDSIGVDMSVTTKGKWQIKPLMALVPEKFAKSLSDLDVDGEAELQAIIQGYVSEKQMPRVQAHLTLDDGEGSYKPLPYTLRDVEMDATADIRLTEGQISNVEIHKLHAATLNSQLSILNSQLSDLMGDMLLDLALRLDANLPDFAYFLPKEMTLNGKAKGTAKAKIRLDDLTNMRLEKGKISADLDLRDIHYAMDSMIADLPKTHAVLQLPNPKPSKPKVNWARIDLTTDKVDFEMATPLKAALKASAIQLEAGNVLSKDPVLYAAVGLQTERPLEVEMDSMGGTLDAPQLTLYAEYNTKDTTVMPVAQATLACDALDGFFKDIKADLKQSRLEASVSGGRKDKSAPRLKAKLLTDGLNANMGEELTAKTGKLDLEAAARYKAGEENILLQWNPRLVVKLKNGELNLPERLPETVYIPSIDFNYSNREMAINDARVELGNSDLNLKGNVRHIGKWFRHEGILEGELDIVSNHCDANQLLAWFSADEGSEEESNPTPSLPAVEGEKTATTTSPEGRTGGVSETEPFLVPTDVDLALNTHMQEVEIFNQTAKDLKGGIFVKDGTLILDEMGFVCRAAKLQLTAMYRTPRRSHLYLGFDYHMIDVDIDELLTMIPNLEQMVPMLSSFKGAAQFHLAAETYLNSQYQPKMSTLRGAASLTGKDLVVLDGETFSKISKLLLFNKKTENRIDSINAELTVYKNEIDVYPLCVQMDNYMVALGGRHNTDMTFNYDINVLSPIYLGVNVSGNIDDLKIKLAKCKFAQDFRPRWFDKADTQSRELRQRIKASMERNVRIKSNQE
ncbi:MAG: AsmA family protein [Paludibacteraceae bacterium]|nr:AsmA family protein [Paludibacteraceae bacterium]